jgi:hypothetical protein
MSGAAYNDYFGRSVASAGDVNGDGYADAIVGAHYADAGGTNRGQAYIYYGGSSMDATADVTMSGAADNDYLGFSVASADPRLPPRDAVLIRNALLYAVRRWA